MIVLLIVFVASVIGTVLTVLGLLDVIFVDSDSVWLLVGAVFSFLFALIAGCCFLLDFFDFRRKDKRRHLS